MAAILQFIFFIIGAILQLMIYATGSSTISPGPWRR